MATIKQLTPDIPQSDLLTWAKANLSNPTPPASGVYWESARLAVDPPADQPVLSYRVSWFYRPNPRTGDVTNPPRQDYVVTYTPSTETYTQVEPAPDDKGGGDDGKG